MNAKLLIILCCAWGAAGMANASEPLARSKNCLSCHQAASKLVGPAFKDVAAKYKGDKKAAVTLAAKVREGGKGVWGEIPMPPNAVDEKDAKRLVDWILAQK